MHELKNNSRRDTTIRDIKRHVLTFSEWWVDATRDYTETPLLPVVIIDRRHLLEFRTWLLYKGYSNCGANRHVATVRQILRCAERNHIIEHAPRLECLPHRSIAPKVYLDNEQITRLWEVAPQLRWPTRTHDKKLLKYSPGEGWRASLVFWRTYGFRTQELIRMERKYRALRWRDIYPPGMTPNGEGHCECDFGWLQYTPQKQERIKPEPLTNPLTNHVVAALNVLGRGGRVPYLPIFDWVLSSTSFRATWNEWMVLAGVKPREASGLKRFVPKHFRKTAVTYINLHRPGMAQWIVGHGSDRSGQNSMISSRHYDNAEAGVLDTLMTYPQPECFDELLAA